MSPATTADKPEIKPQNKGDRSPQSHADDRSPRGNRPLRVGFIGTGFIADWHAKALKYVTNAQLTAVCDAHDGRRDAFAEAYNIDRRYGDWATLLAEESLDAVQILLPPHLHFAAAKDALEAGVAVLVEKPMCATAAECEELVAIAQRTGTYLAVSQNFSFDPDYESLREDVGSGRLGRVDQITITWNRELPQILHASPSGWLFDQPENIILEVGPHSVAHMLDLMGGPPQDISVRVDRPHMLSNGNVCYRRWLVDCDYGDTLVRLVFSFVPGYTEHTVHVRGSLGSAVADLEAWTYEARCHSPSQDDFNRYSMTKDRGRSLAKQARQNIVRYVASKFKLSQRGNQYQYSIRQALEAFYRGVAGDEDARISGETGAEIIRVCTQIGAASNDLPTPEPRFIVSQQDNADCETMNCGTTTLVLGGTGFIGRELVRQLVDAGHHVRVLARDTQRFAGDPRWEQAEVVRGDLSDDDSLRSALDGVGTVYHLARAYGNTWEEFEKGDIPLTERVGRLCVEAGVARLVYTGTIDSYYAGQKGDVITEETPLDPKIHLRKPYSRAKAVSEDLLLKMHREQGLPLVIARPGIVVGRGGDPYHWGVGMFTNQAVAHLWGDGENKLPFVLVEDVAAALVAMHDAEKIDGEIFNLIGDPLLNAKEYVAEFEKCADVKFQVRPTPIVKYYVQDMTKYAVKVLVRHPGRYRPSFRDWQGRTQLAHFDCTKAKRVLGWQPVSDRETLIARGIHEPVREYVF